MYNKDQDKSLHVFDNKDFLKSPEARALRILGEYLYPASVFKDEEVTDTIVFFGSSRIFPKASMIGERDLSQIPKKSAPDLKNYGVFFEDAVDLAEQITRWADLYEQKK